MGDFRSRVLIQTDKRVKLISELISNIFYVKLSCYEDFFASKIFSARDEEVHWLRRTGYISSVAANCVGLASYLSAMTTILILIGTNPTNSLTASVAFTLLSLYFGIWLPLIMFNNAVSRFGAALPCFSRLNALMSLEVMDSRPNWDENAKESYVKVDAGTFQYTMNKKRTEGKEELFRLANVDFQARAGQLVMVAGAVGSGKSTLLKGLIGQVDLIGGALSTGGKVAYCAQSPFIINGSLRDNVLFGSTFEELRYNECLELACLGPDLEMLSNGNGKKKYIYIS